MIWGEIMPLIGFLTLSIIALTLVAPTIFELKKPKDAGPRKIIDIPINQINLPPTKVTPRTDNQLLRRIYDAIVFLPDLELTFAE